MDNSCAIIAGPASLELAEKVASKVGTSAFQAQVRIFSDGESKIQLQDFGPDKRTCVIIQSTYPPVDRHLVQLLMIARGCQQYGAKEIVAVVPYLAYARQDRAFLGGEVVSIDLMSRLMASVGITRLITVDIHSILALSFFPGSENLTAIPRLANFVKSLNLNRPIVVSPDAGGVDRARQFSQLLHCEMIGLRKTRDRQSGEISIEDPGEGSTIGRDVLLVDDMISSGSSIAKASEMLLKNGARRTFAVCTHALLVENAEDKIRNSGVTDIIASNSIPGKYSKVDLSAEVAALLSSRPELNASKTAHNGT